MSDIGLGPLQRRGPRSVSGGGRVAESCLAFTRALRPRCPACGSELRLGPRLARYEGRFATCEPPCGQELYLRHLGEGMALSVRLRPAEAEVLRRRGATMSEMFEALGVLR